MLSNIHECAFVCLFFAVQCFDTTLEFYHPILTLYYKYIILTLNEIISNLRTDMGFNNTHKFRTLVGKKTFPQLQMASVYIGYNVHIYIPRVIYIYTIELLNNCSQRIRSCSKKCGASGTAHEYWLKELIGQGSRASTLRSWEVVLHAQHLLCRHLAASDKPTLEDARRYSISVFSNLRLAS